jgi:hypothetical protein
MNADLMITIAFCLIVLFGSLAAAVLIAQSVRDDKAKEAEAKRLAAEAEIRQPTSARGADESDVRALSAAGDPDPGLAMRSGAVALARARTSEGQRPGRSRVVA